MGLKTDTFVRTMLYGELNYGSSTREAPAEEIKVYDDETMSYKTSKGDIREIEVSEEQLGKLDVRIYDIKTNELIDMFSMQYEEIDCSQCKRHTIHAKKNNRFYCTECGTYRE